MERAFGEILGIKDITRVRAIIERLDATQQIRNSSAGLKYVLDFLPQLPSIRIEEHSVFMGTRKMNVLKRKPLGQGTYGTVYVSKDGTNVYKKIVIKNDTDESMEEDLRSVLIELFIQTLLSLDPEIGKHICKPVHLFRSESTVRRSSRLNASNNSEIVLYIQMEPIKYSFRTYLKSIKDDTHLNWTHIAPLFVELGTVLAKCKDKYGFYHGDLHTGNVMIGADGDIKLIDFGMSCMTYAGRMYRSVLYYDTLATPCESFDLLIFLCDIMENHEDIFDIPTKRMINSLFVNADRKNIYKSFVRYAEYKKNKKNKNKKDEDKKEEDPIFWLAYMNKLEEIDKKFKGRNLLPAVRTLELTDPRRFVEKVESMQYSPSNTSGGGRRKTIGRRRIGRRRTTRRLKD